MADEERKQVNIDFSSDPDLLDHLDKMVKADDMNRSQFIRKLVRQEIARRMLQQPLPLPTTNKITSRKTRKDAAQAVAA